MSQQPERPRTPLIVRKMEVEQIYQLLRKIDAKIKAEAAETAKPPRPPDPA